MKKIRYNSSVLLLFQKRYHSLADNYYLDCGKHEQNTTDYYYLACGKKKMPWNSFILFILKDKTLLIIIIFSVWWIRWLEIVPYCFSYETKSYWLLLASLWWRRWVKIFSSWLSFKIKTQNLADHYYLACDKEGALEQFCIYFFKQNTYNFAEHYYIDCGKGNTLE